MQHLSEEQIAQYAEALARGTQKNLPVELRRHVKECDKCADEVMAVYELISAQERAGAGTAKGRKFFMRPAYWISVAAGITILVGVGGYLIFYGEKTAERLPVAEQQKHEQATGQDQMAAKSNTMDTDTVRELLLAAETNNSLSSAEDDDADAVPEKKLLAQAYKPHAGLEQLAGRYDNVAMRGEGFELKSPHTNTVQLGEEVTLSWKASGKEKYIFTLLDNEEEIVLEKAAGASGVVLEDSLQQGLYYWKLINQDFDLLYCGKIKVK